MKKTKKALASLAIAGMVLSMAPASVFAADDNRIAGADRYATSIQIAEKAYASATTAVIAAGNPSNLVDALAAAPLAAQEKAPIYLTDKADMNDNAVASLKKLGVSKVFVVGAAASEAVVKELKAEGLEVVELKGAGRVETAEAINAKLTAPKGTIVVGYNGVADAMSVASYAAANNYAIVVAKADGTIPGTAAADYVIGGPTMVKDIAGAERIFGADRYETNKKVLAELAFDFGTVYVGNGATLADALVASVLAGQTKSPIALSNGKTVAAASVASEKMTASSKTIALGGTGVVSDAAVNSVKYQAPVVNDLAVESVSAINAKQIEVKFNKAVDAGSAESTANYDIDSVNSDAVSGITITKAELEDDDQTVTLTLGTTLNNNSSAKYSVNITDVVDKEGEEVEEYTAIENLYDTAAPYVTGLAFDDSQTIKVTFSEPINAGAAGIAGATKIKLDGATVSMLQSKFTVASNGKSVKIDVSALDTEKTYSIEIKDLQDYGTNAMTKYSDTFVVEKDTVDPTVKSVTVMDRNDLVVEFSEKVKTTSGVNNAFRVKVDGYVATATITNYSSTSPDGKKFKVNITAIPGAPASMWSAGELSEGNHVVTVYNFQDLANNPTSAATSSYSEVKAFADAKPALNSTVGKIRNIAGTYYIVFEFDRDVQTAGAANTVVNGTRVTDGVTFENVPSLTLLDSGDVTGLEKKEIAILASAVGTAGSYKVDLTAGAVADSFGNSISKTSVTFSYTGSEVENTVTGVSVQPAGDNNRVVVNFSGEVGADALVASHYTVDGVAVFASAEYFNNKSNVLLKMNDGAITSSGNKVFKISGIDKVADRTYNGVGSNPAKLAFNENEKPAVSKVELISLNKVKVTFSESVVNAGLPANYEVKVDGVVKTITTISAFDNVAMISLPSSLSSTSVPVSVEIKKGGTNIQDGKGNQANVGQLTNATVNISDLEGVALAKVQAATAKLTKAGGEFTGALASATSADVAAFRSLVDEAKDAMVAAGVANDATAGMATQFGVTAEVDTWQSMYQTLEYVASIYEAEDYANTADLSVSDNYTNFYTTMQTDITNLTVANVGTTAKTALDGKKTALFAGATKTALDTALADVLAAKTASTDAVATTNATTVGAAETAITTAWNGTTGTVKDLDDATTYMGATITSLKAQIASAKSSVAAKLTFAVTGDNVAAATAQMDLTGNFITGTLNNTTGYTVTTITNATYTAATATWAFGTAATADTVVTVTNDFWGVSDTVTVSIATGASVKVVND